MGWRTGRGRGLQWSTKLPIDDCRLTIERIRKSKFAARSRGNRAFTSFDFRISTFEGKSLHSHTSDAVTLETRDRKPVASKNHLLAAGRDDPQARENKARHGLIAWVARQRDAVVFLQLPQAQRAVYLHRVLADLLDVFVLLVVLVVDFAHDLLQHVFDGDDSDESPELIHHQRHLRAAPARPLQHLA